MRAWAGVPWGCSLDWTLQAERDWPWVDPVGARLGPNGLLPTGPGR